MPRNVERSSLGALSGIAFALTPMSGMATVDVDGATMHGVGSQAPRTYFVPRSFNDDEKDQGTTPRINYSWSTQFTSTRDIATASASIMSPDLEHFDDIINKRKWGKFWADLFHAKQAFLEDDGSVNPPMGDAEVVAHAISNTLASPKLSIADEGESILYWDNDRYYTELSFVGDQTCEYFGHCRVTGDEIHGVFGVQETLPDELISFLSRISGQSTPRSPFSDNELVLV